MCVAGPLPEIFNPLVKCSALFENSFGVAKQCPLKLKHLLPYVVVPRIVDDHCMGLDIGPSGNYPVEPAEEPPLDLPFRDEYLTPCSHPPSFL